MYARLGIHWASSIPAFLTLACLPFSFVTYKNGVAIRRCKYANEAAEVMARMQLEHHASDLEVTEEEVCTV